MQNFVRENTRIHPVGIRFIASYLLPHAAHRFGRRKNGQTAIRD